MYHLNDSIDIWNCFNQAHFLSKNLKILNELRTFFNLPGGLSDHDFMVNFFIFTETQKFWYHWKINFESYHVSIRNLGSSMTPLRDTGCLNSLNQSLKIVKLKLWSSFSNLLLRFLNFFHQMIFLSILKRVLTLNIFFNSGFFKKQLHICKRRPPDFLRNWNLR